MAALAAIVLAIGGIAMLVRYANGAEERAFEGTKLVTVLQVTAPIDQNTPVAEIAGRVKSIKLPAAAIAEGAIADLGAVNGLSTTVSLEPGEQLLKSRFGVAGSTSGAAGKPAVPAGMQEISIPLTTARLAGGQVKAGDMVGIFASYPAGAKRPEETGVLANEVLVTRVEGGSVNVAANNETAAAIVTVALKTRDVENLVHAIEFAKVWLSKQNKSTDTSGAKVVDRRDILP